MIEALEQELIREVREASGGKIAVRPYPKDPSSYRLTHKTGEALVRYLGSDYVDRSTDGYLQRRKMRYEVIVVFRDLRSPAGAQGGYAILDALRQHISGVVLSGVRTFCRIDSDRFVGEDDGIWQWAISLSFEAPVTLQLDQNNAPPLQLAGAATP